MMANMSSSEYATWMALSRLWAEEREAEALAADCRQRAAQNLAEAKNLLG